MYRHHQLITGSLIFLISILFTGCALNSSRQVRDFDFDWKFVKDDMPAAIATNYDDSGWRDVQVPHDWSIEGPYSTDYASGTGFLPGGIGWYRKSFTLDASQKGNRIAIEFDGVYNNSEVWINGHYLGKRPFGYISFQYDLTDYVKFGSVRNVVAVRVDHSQFADSRWYTGSGIYRHVRLRITNPLHVDHWGTFVTTPVANKGVGLVKIETTVKNDSTELKAFTLKSSIFDAQGNLIKTVQSERTIAAGSSRLVEQSAGVLNPQLWSPDHPSLYTLKSEVIDGLFAVDVTTTRFGIRAFRFDPDKGFFLNGENMKLKGMCLHHDAGCVGAAVPKKMWVRRLVALKKVGCNAIRCSHNPPSPEFLDACDELGFLVQDEAFDEFTPTKNKWVDGWNQGTPSRAGYGEVFEQWAVRDIQDMVRRDRNHPSIIMWSIGNEIDYRNDPFSDPSLGDEYRPDHPSAKNLTKYGKMLVDAVKEIDTTRPTTAALATAPMSNAVGFSDVLDIVGYNYQEKYYAEHHGMYPGRVLYGSENGQGYEAWKAVADNDYISAQFLWTGIDYLGEAGAWPTKSWTRSPFDLCGFKKPAAWQRQSWWTDEPMVFIACRQRGGQSRRSGPRAHWNWADDASVRVVCYTNCDEVELFLNDASLGAKSYSEASQGVLRWNDCEFEAGALKAVGKREGKTVCEAVLQTAGAPERLELIADTQTLKADGKDICHLEFRVVDAQGLRVPDAEDQVTFRVRGPAHIIGLGNGNPQSHESHQGNTRKVWHGRGLAVIQSERKGGVVTIEASADNVTSATVSLTVK